jgi:hypothetical protein
MTHTAIQESLDDCVVDWWNTSPTSRTAKLNEVNVGEGSRCLNGKMIVLRSAFLVGCPGVQL